jgi:hypothetical protein
MVAGSCLCEAVTHQVAERPVVFGEIDPDAFFDDWVSAKGWMEFDG